MSFLGKLFGRNEHEDGQHRQRMIHPIESTDADERAAHTRAMMEAEMHADAERARAQRGAAGED